jgi:hypothetical protein
MENHSLYEYKNKNVFIRTVTHHYTGKIIKVTEKDIILKDASWIADDGRFHKFLNDPVKEVCECEPYHNDVVLMIGAILDVTEIDELLRGVK